MPWPDHAIGEVEKSTFRAGAGIIVSLYILPICKKRIAGCANMESHVNIGLMIGGGNQMSPDQFALLKYLDQIEHEEAEQEAARALKQAQENMLRGFIILKCPQIVPASMAPGWMQQIED